MTTPSCKRRQKNLKVKSPQENFLKPPTYFCSHPIIPDLKIAWFKSLLISSLFILMWHECTLNYPRTLSITFHGKWYETIIKCSRAWKTVTLNRVSSVRENCRRLLRSPHIVCSPFCLLTIHSKKKTFTFLAHIWWRKCKCWWR